MSKPITVSEILQLNFSQLSFQEKLQVKQRGRDTPALDNLSIIAKSHGKMYTRKFSKEWYKKKDWLCGCEERNKLFCFQCCIFGGEETWSRNGFKAIAKMSEKCKKHEQSKTHVSNCVSFSMLCSSNNIQRHMVGGSQAIILHNEKVKKNLNILSHIIDAVFVCGNCETALRGHDESKDSANPGVFRSILNYGAKLSPDLEHHLKTSTVFKGTSKTIQNDIINCVLQVYRQEVKKEIAEAKYLAVIADETTDVAGCFSLYCT